MEDLQDCLCGPEFRYYRNGNFLDSGSISRAGGNNTVSRGDGQQLAWTLDNMLLYNKIFGDHSIGVTLLQSASKSQTETSSISEQKIPMPSFLWNNLGAVDVTDTQYQVGIGSGLTGNQLSSYMARVNYSFMDRYRLMMWSILKRPL